MFDTFLALNIFSPKVTHLNTSYWPHTETHPFSYDIAADSDTLTRQRQGEGGVKMFSNVVVYLSGLLKKCVLLMLS